MATLRVALAGDTTFGRGVAKRLAEDPSTVLVAPEIEEIAKEADLVVLNLECCVSERGGHRPHPDKPILLSCTASRDTHPRQLGHELRDTGEQPRPRLRGRCSPRHLRVLRRCGHCLGRGWARPTTRPASGGLGGQPGIAYADLRTGVPKWLEAIASSARSGLPEAPDAIVVTPHWGSKMVTSPVRHVQRASACLIETGATVVPGHSAHVFHEVSGAVPYDLGDFLDDYAGDPLLRNDLGLLFVVTLDEEGPKRIEAIPLALDYCHTRLPTAEDAAWIVRRLRAAREEIGTGAAEEDGRLVVDYPRSDPDAMKPGVEHGRQSRRSHSDGRLLQYGLSCSAPGPPRSRPLLSHLFIG